VERIELMPDGQTHIRLDVMAPDLSRRHKSDDFNSFLMHWFFEGRCNKELQICFKGVACLRRIFTSGVACGDSCGHAWTIKVLPTNPSGSVRYCNSHY
jgi:hypothetical protein